MNQAEKRPEPQSIIQQNNDNLPKLHPHEKHIPQSTPQGSYSGHLRASTL